jgi:hypothetical protein
MGLGPWVCVKHDCSGMTGECLACKSPGLTFGNLNAESFKLFVDDAVAKEREACAAECDDEARRQPMPVGKSSASRCGYRIRQRGDK